MQVRSATSIRLALWVEEYRTGSDSDRVQSGMRLMIGSIEPEGNESGTPSRPGDLRPLPVRRRLLLNAMQEPGRRSMTRADSYRSLKPVAIAPGSVFFDPLI